MHISSPLKPLVAAFFVAALTACGGGSDGDIKAVPTGGALSNVWFADSDGYFPLDKLQPSGTFYTGSESDFGPVNPAFTAGDKFNSRWAIDTSATVEDGHQLSYSMDITSVNTSAAAIDSLKANLRLDGNTGLITQYCTGFPNCYANATVTEEDFLITVNAKVVGGKGTLTRNFILRVR
jgi:hypothetical protein